MLGLERAVIGRAAAVREPAHDDLIAADHLLTIDAEVLPLVSGPRVVVSPQVISGATSSGQQVWIGQPDRSTSGPSHDHLLADRAAHRARRHVQDLLEKRQRAPCLADAARGLRRAQRREQPAEVAQCLRAVEADRGGDAFLGAEQVARAREPRGRSHS